MDEAEREEQVHVENHGDGEVNVEAPTDGSTGGGNAGDAGDAGDAADANGNAGAAGGGGGAAGSESKTPVADLGNKALNTRAK